MGVLSELLPALTDLNLNGSLVPSFRCFAPHFPTLKVLKLCNCGLNDLDGICTTVPMLEELYASFNAIASLEPLALGHDYLAVLDLEGNSLADMVDLDYLYVSAPDLLIQ